MLSSQKVQFPVRGGSFSDPIAGVSRACGLPDEGLPGGLGGGPGLDGPNTTDA